MEITERTETALDRLSIFDEDLLLFILGNLNTLNAVKNCVQSRRWRNLWKSLPSLYFRWAGSCAGKRNPAFSDLLTQVLLCRDHSDLVKFQLFPIVSATNSCLVESSLEYAIKHNVKFIVFGNYNYGYQRTLVFPRCFFDSSSLQGLELRYACSNCITWPPNFNWPALKSLYLEDFILGEGNFDGRIFSSCPSLETLKLVSLYTTRDLKEKTFDIHSLSLRSLELVYRGKKFPPIIVIMAANLTTFKFRGRQPPVKFSVDARSLHTVTINLLPMFGLHSSSQVCIDENARETILRSIKMVNEFRLAKSLSISAEAVKVLSALPDLLELHLRKFENLKEFKLVMQEVLQFGNCFSISPGVLSYFMSKSTAFKLECVESKLW